MHTPTARHERLRPADLARLVLAGAALLLLAIFGGVNLAVAGEGDWPADGAVHYYAAFDPSAVPWRPAEEMNIEEVFKNWQYFAIRFEPGADRLTVERFERGQAAETTRWRRRADGGLARTEGDGS